MPAIVNQMPASRARPPPAVAPAEARALARRRAGHDRRAREGRRDSEADGEQDRVGERHGRLRPGRQPGARHDLDEGRGQVRRRVDAVQRHSRPAHPGGEAGVPFLDRRPEPGAQQRVTGVDDELLPGLRVLDDDEAGLGQLIVGRVNDAQRHDLMARPEAQQRSLPVPGSDEVGDDDDQRPAPGQLGDRVEHGREIGGAPARAVFPPPRPAAPAAAAGAVPPAAVAVNWPSARDRAVKLRGDAQHVTAAAARRDGTHRPVVVQQRADLVAAPAEHPGEHYRELAEHVVLAPARYANRHGGRAVEHQPDGELAVLVEDPELRLVQPGGDVPVDVPRVVALLVGAQAGEVDSCPAVRRAVPARHAALNPAQHPPLKAEQQPFRGGARRR